MQLSDWLACVGPGWHGIITPLIEYCNKNNIEIHQVKEKFGGLRFYSEANTPEFDKMLEDAEAKANVTCEVCGEPGVIGTNKRGSWLRCTCKECWT